jgi:Ca2+-transporting ATPase
MPKLKTGKISKRQGAVTKPKVPETGEAAARIETPWHILSGNAVLQEFGTDAEQGLSEAQAEARLEEYGPNALPGQKPPTLMQIFLHQFKNPLIYILLLAAIASLLIGDDKDAVFIFAVLLINATLGTTQEWKAEKSAAALQSLIQTQAHVIRDGKRRDVPQSMLVPGELVCLESGNKVPADIRLLETNNLSIDEALLTGESMPVEKSSNPLQEREVPIGDRLNMAYAGSLIARGRGTGVVVATGHQTEMGKIAKSVSTGRMTKTPLIIRMEQFTRRIAFVVLGGTLLLGVIAILKGMPAMEALFFTIALAVSTIPEGIPVVLTIALSIATQRMARRNVIIRKLPAVEGLGSCTYIVSDKTGTLTVNKQTLRQVLLPDGERFKVSGEGYHGEGEVSPIAGGMLAPEHYARLGVLAKAGILCNEGALQFQPAAGEWTHQGDAVDVAILAFGYKLGLEPQQIRKSVEITGQIHYESERGYAATFYREDSQDRVAVKGAGEYVLPFCRWILTDKGEQPIDRHAVDQQTQAFAEEGYRVLAVASGNLEPNQGGAEAREDNLPPLTLLGFIGMIDPLRPDAKGAVMKCRQAGIQVAMVTGDHPATALTIARDLGIADSWDDIITGQDLSRVCALERTACIEKIKNVRVFARVSPIQKLDIVDTLIDQGHFVAVTGDGVNDAPALRKANIGVAMGSGSDITKDISDIIITNDNFATIEAGVEEGRFAYANIRKVIWFLIANGTAEIILFMLALLSNQPLPLIPVQILWANLVTSGIQDIGLAFEAGNPEVMKHPPKKTTEGLFNRPMIRQTLVPGITMGLVCFGVFSWLMRSGYDLAYARNLTLLTLVLLENYNAFNCRSEYRSAFKIPIKNNYVLVLGVIIAHAFHLFAMNTPLFQEILGLSPVSFIQWLQLAALAASVLIVVEVFKWLRVQPKAGRNQH